MSGHGLKNLRLHSVSHTPMARLICMNTQLKKWIPALLWMCFIFATSCTYISARGLSEAVTTHGPVALNARQFDSFWWWVFVKGYHVLEYAFLTALLLKAMGGRVITAGLSAIAFASSDEFHQTFVQYRGGKWTDVAIDSIGISIVCIAAILLAAWKLQNLGPARPNFVQY